MMSLRGKIEAAIAAVLLVGGFFAFRSWLGEHDLRLRAEAQGKAQEAAQADAAQKISELQKQMAERDAEYKTELQSLNTKFSQAQNPSQIALLVSQLMGGLKQPIQITTPPATATNPNPQPVAQVPLVDAPQVKAYFQECEQCKAERVKLQQDAESRVEEMAAAQKEIDALKEEVGTWKTAAKGGTFWQRTGRAVKWLGIGAAAGAVALCGSGHCK